MKGGLLLRGQVRLVVTTPPSALYWTMANMGVRECHHKQSLPQLSHFNIFTCWLPPSPVTAVQRIVILGVAWCGVAWLYVLFEVVCGEWCVVCGVYNSIRQEAGDWEVTEGSPVSTPVTASRASDSFFSLCNLLQTPGSASQPQSAN